MTTGCHRRRIACILLSIKLTPLNPRSCFGLCPVVRLKPPVSCNRGTCGLDSASQSTWHTDVQVDDINVRDAAGLTPLHWAAKARNVAAVAWLLENGANVSALDHALATPLHYAALVPGVGCKSPTDVAAAMVCLLQHQAATNVADVNQQTPLHWASTCSQGGYNHVEQLTAPLLKAGAAADATDVLRNTPLHLVTATGGSCRAIDKLVEAGACMLSVNSRGDTPMHTAVGYGTCGRRQLQCLLRQIAGGRQCLKLANKAGFTPLQLGAVVGWRLSSIMVLAEDHDSHQETDQLLQQVVLDGWRCEIADYLLQSDVGSQSMLVNSLSKAAPAAHEQQQAQCVLEPDFVTSVPLRHGRYVSKLLRQHLSWRLCHMVPSGLVLAMFKTRCHKNRPSFCCLSHTVSTPCS